MELDAAGTVPPLPSTAPQRHGSSTSAPGQGSGNASGTAGGYGGLADYVAAAAASSAGAAAAQQGGGASVDHYYAYSAAPYPGQPPLPGQEQQQQGSMGWMPYPAAATSSLDPAAVAAAASYGASMGKALAEAYLGQQQQQQHYHFPHYHPPGLPSAAGWGAPHPYAPGGGGWDAGPPPGAAHPPVPPWRGTHAAEAEEPLQFRRLPEDKKQLVLEFGAQWRAISIVQRPKELAIEQFEVSLISWFQCDRLVVRHSGDSGNVPAAGAGNCTSICAAPPWPQQQW